MPAVTIATIIHIDTPPPSSTLSPLFVAIITIVNPLHNPVWQRALESAPRNTALANARETKNDSN
eukprot:9794988-Lingulodinium_polyedra.AAC.1